MEGRQLCSCVRVAFLPTVRLVRRPVPHVPGALIPEPRLGIGRRESLKTHQYEVSWCTRSSTLPVCRIEQEGVLLRDRHKMAHLMKPGDGVGWDAVLVEMSSEDQTVRVRLVACSALSRRIPAPDRDRLRPKDDPNVSSRLDQQRRRRYAHLLGSVDVRNSLKQLGQQGRDLSHALILLADAPRSHRPSVVRDCLL